MTVRKVLRMGDPRLREIAQPVPEYDTPELHELISDMKDTMDAYDGAGLAAIQIGVMLRVMIFGVESNPRYPDVEPIAMTVLVNPHLEILSEERSSGWEGCLSVPGMRALVPRYSIIRYRGFDEFGKAIERDADGFHARVFQHEFDHLEGILYPDKIEDILSFGFTEEVQAANAS
jgi:peptide deformylase